MKIGILTYYKVPNFGANLQALSTYYYLKNKGHDVFFLHYISRITEFKLGRAKKNIQVKYHIDFINEQLKEQSYKLRNAADIIKCAKDYNLDAIIIGSDAVTQHHPWFSTFKFGRPGLYTFFPIESERRFPNPYWGCGIVNKIPTAMISVSSQNSPYPKFASFTKRKMARVLEQMKYISVRDNWTKKMMLAAHSNLNISVTPDPVFALNQNLISILPSKEDIRNRFNLPEKYVLVSMKSQSLSYDKLVLLQDKFEKRGIVCVDFPITNVMRYHSPFAVKIDLPLSPLDWFSIIKYASAYIGSNMHPIVVSLHNAVPCYSLDNWGTTNFWGKKLKDDSSKVYDILSLFGLEHNRSEVENGTCNVEIDDIIRLLDDYPVGKVKVIADALFNRYSEMMNNAITSLSK